MATVLTLRILDNGDQLKAECERTPGGDHVAVHYYKNDKLMLVQEYQDDEPLWRVFDDIGNYMAVIC